MSYRIRFTSPDGTRTFESYIYEQVTPAEAEALARQRLLVSHRNVEDYVATVIPRVLG